jgi:hypothetical protein
VELDATSIRRQTTQSLLLFLFFFHHNSRFSYAALEPAIEIALR